MDIFLVLKEIVKHTSRVESRTNFTGKSCGSWLMITLFCSTCFTIPKNFDLECIDTVRINEICTWKWWYVRKKFK